ncbi:uncharacterized protein A4U43_C02F11750 [Asparagus officinalis]|uniref:WW domain-containing protein n=1 Tax=Asparagus officinalis TaxID=4686 RepID=A0A5P1FHS4_ASPOF|nr:uncharacterized protein LOC109830635 [Asparagus officinalis]ONK77878.1 uncharacterized protein A4U43_C02F11750 [Asparagus officinalis]
MPGPNIEMIAKSLRNCSLSGRSRGGRSPAVRSPPPQRRSGEVTVELNSEVALPYHWEQCLDMRTGEIYYRNWTTGKTTTTDPRHAALDYRSSSSDDDSSDDGDESSNEGERDNYFSSGDSSTTSSSSSSASSAAYAPPEVTSGQVLVAAGCKYCFMYFMVPKQDPDCPKCGRVLLHLGRSNG